MNRLTMVTYSLTVRKYKSGGTINYMFDGVNIKGRGTIRIAFKDGELTINIECEGDYEKPLHSNLERNIGRLLKDLNEDVLKMKERDKGK